VSRNVATSAASDAVGVSRSVRRARVVLREPTARVGTRTLNESSLLEILPGVDAERQVGRAAIIPASSWARCRSCVDEYGIGFCTCTREILTLAESDVRTVRRHAVRAHVARARGVVVPG
jgi:hypothetical protein